MLEQAVGVRCPKSGELLRYALEYEPVIGDSQRGKEMNDLLF
jgi:hypothetical protein